jgi:NTE family protein
VVLRSSAADPRGTGGWLELANFKSHHHVVLDEKESYERVARRISGRAWGLVLGGGGARGLSHIGTIQALRENGMPIDWVGGTSMGAIIAAQLAMGLSVEDMIRVTRKAYAGPSRSRDFTFPFVSMRTGRSTIDTLQEIFGDRRIEDLPTNYFCVSCNLTRADVVVHDRGPVWMWARVSCSVPGLLPPVPHQGDLLVDGGLLQNLPVEIMRHRCGGYVIASDVSVAADLTVNTDLTSEVGFSGFSHLVQKLRKRPTLPDIFRVLMRTAEVSSVRDSKVSGSPADLYLHPPLDSVGMTDFLEIDRIIAIGYEYALRRSKDWKTEHPGSVI